MKKPAQNYEKEQEKAEKKLAEREKKKKPQMQVSGKSVFELKRLKHKKVK